jgi:hypothetical protein
MKPTLDNRRPLMNPLRKFLSSRSHAAWIVLPAIALIVLAIVLPAGRKREFAKSKGITAFQAESERAAGYELGDASRPEAKPAAPALRKVIVTHDMTIEIKNLEAAFHTAIDLAKASGGYTTETSRVRNDDGSYLGRVVMRVPPGTAGGLLDKLRAFGTVTSENSTGEDITDVYVDMEARLKNMRASEVRLQNLMMRQTRKLADVLAVEQELTRVRGDIESLEAQKRTWDTLTALVTIRVEFVEPKGALPALSKVWHPIRTAFGAALEGFSESLHTLIVFVGTILPWSLFFGLPVYLYLKLRRKKLSNAKAVK